MYHQCFFFSFNFSLKAPASIKKENNRKRKNSLDSGTHRPQKTCPVPSCGSEVVHLPRHLKDVHGWPKERARTALTRFGMRKKYTFTSPGKAPKKKKKTEKIDNTDDKVQADSKPNDYHHYRYCPVDGCTSLVKRITPHLKKVHNLKAGSDAYIRALSRV